MSLDGPTKPPNKTTKDAFFRETLARLPDAKPTSDGWHAAKCPAHDDENPSLSVKQAADGNVLLKCHAGCEPTAVLVALGLATVHDYRDADGKLYGQVVKQKANGYKAFTVRRPDGNGGWAWNWTGLTRTLYRLPELLEADLTRWVAVVEGEKDADNLAALGFVVTTNPHGAEKWADAYSEALRGRCVVILPDNDAAGERHAAQVGRSLHGIAKETRVVRLPRLEKGEDVSDWLTKRGGNVKELNTLLAQAPPYEPSEPVPTPSEPAPVEPVAEPALVEVDDGYEVVVPMAEGTATFTFTYVTEGRQAGRRTLNATALVTYARQGARDPYEGHVDLLSTSGRDSLAKELSGWFTGHWADVWRPPVTSACVLAGRAYDARSLAESDCSIDMSTAPTADELTVRWRARPLVLAEGSSLLFAEWSSGKSLLAMGISICVATGAPFLGEAVERGAVIYADFEATGKRNLKRRVARLLAGMGLTWADLGGRLHLWAAGGRSLTQQLPALRRRIRETGAVLLVVDSAGYVSGDPLKEAEAPTGLYRSLETLGVSVLVLHHEAKDSDGKTAYGSVYFMAGARLAWNVQTPPDAPEGDDLHLALICRKFNEGRPPDPLGVLVHFEGETGPITLTAEEPAPEHFGDVTQTAGNQILATVRACGPRSVAELAKETGLAKDVVAVRVSNLIHAGTLVRLLTNRDAKGGTRVALPEYLADQEGDLSC
jgi:5S rRNA maturation endonuclease (ribonuclease M5)